MLRRENFSVEWSCFYIDNEAISKLSEEWKGEAENSITNFFYTFAKKYTISSLWDMFLSSGILRWQNKPE